MSRRTNNLIDLIREDPEQVLEKVILNEYDPNDLNRIIDLLAYDGDGNHRTVYETRCCAILRAILAGKPEMTAASLSEMSKWIGVKDDKTLQWQMVTNPNTPSEVIAYIVTTAKSKKVRQIGCAVLMARGKK